ncbi:MAG: hypothetical protein FJ194_04050 [Gammaproteobacteria bacterium]|nr:hypothetical protein [Gammaproteobacteria bacterium]
MRQWPVARFGWCAPSWVFALACFVTAGCSSTPSLSTQVERGFDLSGRWTLDPSQSDVTPDARRVVDEMDQRMLRRDGFNVRGEMVDSAVFAFIAQDFPVLRATSMSIEQHADSMGIQYEPGGYRDVSWGERSRGLWTIHAGWNESGEFVIHSDSEDIRAQETLALQGPATLQVTLRVRAEGGELDLVRTFVRTP